jgi:hypothetical protein
MDSTKPQGSIGSVASSSAVTLYQGNYDSILYQHGKEELVIAKEYYVLNDIIIFSW